MSVMDNESKILSNELQCDYQMVSSWELKYIYFDFNNWIIDSEKYSIKFSRENQFYIPFCNIFVHINAYLK